MSSWCKASRKLQVTEAVDARSRPRAVYSIDLNRGHCNCNCMRPPRPAPERHRSSRQAAVPSPPLHAGVAGRGQPSGPSRRCTWAAQSHTQRSDRTSRSVVKPLHPPTTRRHQHSAAALAACPDLFFLPAVCFYVRCRRSSMDPYVCYCARIRICAQMPRGNRLGMRSGAAPSIGLDLSGSV
jgi:hypothetical protein